MACYHRPTHHQKDSSGFAGRGGALGLIDEDSVRAEGANGTMVAAGCWKESVTLSLLDAVRTLSIQTVLLWSDSRAESRLTRSCLPSAYDLLPFFSVGLPAKPHPSISSRSHSQPLPIDLPKAVQHRFSRLFTRDPRLSFLHDTFPLSLFHQLPSHPIFNILQPRTSNASLFARPASTPSCPYSPSLFLPLQSSQQQQPHYPYPLSSQVFKPPRQSLA
jgi:hypothetical protein